jgi:hypothetical protein
MIMEPLMATAAEATDMLRVGRSAVYRLIAARQRESFEASEIDIDPEDDKLAAQLGSIKWTVDSRGRIKIESKDEMRKRGLPSPDRADTVAMAISARARRAG